MISPQHYAAHTAAGSRSNGHTAPSNGATHRHVHTLDACPACRETRENEFGKLIGSPVTELLTDLSSPEKIELIQRNFREILHVLGLDLTDDSLNGTPRRVAKMFVNEIFRGLHPDAEPEITLFDNTYGYHHLLLERDIEMNSTCEHHFMPIVGVVHVAYIPREKVVGLSKLNRVVEYYARRPQVQERMTMQIAEFLKYKLETPDVAVVADAKHFCVSNRGVEDPCSSTLTASYSGAFQHDPLVRSEFLQHLRKS
jgi:GTP cyclohydrolase I